MTSSVIRPEAAASGRPGLSSRLLALVPLWVLLIVSMFSPDSFQALRAVPPDVAGMPLGVLVEAVAMLWMLIGLFVILNAETRLRESLALLVFTIPATIVVVFTPAVIILVQNLG